MKPSKSANILVCTVYRPEEERMSEWNVKFRFEMESAYIENKEIISMGDFNIHLFRDDEVPITWKDFNDGFSLTQVIEEPTRVTPQWQSLLDYMYVTQPNNIRQWSVPKSGMSHHFLTSMVRNATTVMIHYRCTKDLDPEKLTAVLEKLHWSILDIFDDPDEALYMWMSLYENVINEHLPWRERHVKREKQPEWWCEEINDATNIRDKYKEENDDGNYKMWWNKVISLIRKAKRDHYIALIDTCRQFFQYVEELDPESPAHPPPKLQVDNDSILTNTFDIATSLNDFIVTLYLLIFHKPTCQLQTIINLKHI